MKTLLLVSILWIVATASDSSFTQTLPSPFLPLFRWYSALPMSPRLPVERKQHPDLPIRDTLGVWRSSAVMWWWVITWGLKAWNINGWTWQHRWCSYIGKDIMRSKHKIVSQHWNKRILQDWALKIRSDLEYLHFWFLCLVGFFFLFCFSSFSFFYY